MTFKSLFLFILLQTVFFNLAHGEDAVTMCGKIKSIDGNQIKIWLLSKDILIGPKNLVKNLKESSVDFQCFDIDKNNLINFNLEKI